MWGQDVTGDWTGVLKVQGIQLRLVLHISKAGDAYAATLDSPDQNANGIPVTAVSYAHPALKFSVANLGVEYEGALGADGKVTGTFKQAGQSFPLELQRGAVEKPETVRPQEPAKPYPYVAEEVSFENREAGIRLAGTLSLPRAGGPPFPAVVLISGSGAQNRDEEILGHKPFLVIADYLTRNGIAVLRCDDRGTAASEGDFRAATSLDLSTDVEAAVNYLLTRREIDRRRIGLIGHSEGGLIAPMVAAARSGDVAFIVLLAGPGIPGDELLLLQDEAISRAAGVSDDRLQILTAYNRDVFDMILQAPGVEELQAVAPARIRELLDKYPSILPEENKEAFIASQVQQLAGPWVKYFLAYDPAPTLERVACPVLALGGEKDLQVPARINLEAIRAALLKGGNQAVTVKELPGLNHLFQECQTGHPSEYGAITQTFSPAALSEILTWIAAVTSYK
jgi:pimeloyl-ACP methyl ester carboxylesterase